MQIVSFSGLAQAGKSTATDELAKWCVANGYTPRRVSFAGALKSAAASVGAIKGSASDALYRKFCQDVGTNLRDPNYCPGITHPDYWVELLGRQLKDIADEEAALLEQGGLFSERVVIIDDARFENELALLRKNQAKLVFIDAGTRLSDLDAEWRQHSSEKLATDYMKGLLPDETFDLTITNNGNEANFRAVIRHMAPIFLNLAADEARR